MAYLLALIAASLPLVAAPTNASQGDDAERANRMVAEALNSSLNPLLQAQAMCQLAWPTSGPRDEAVAARARIALETFGSRYMYALQEALNTAPTGYTDEIVETVMIQQRTGNPAEMPELVPTLIDAVWVGNRAAKERAIRALLMDRPPLAVQPMIDAAIEYPDLTGLVVATLGSMRYEQARFWLERVMFEGPKELRASAASSLAQIRGSALGPLKNGLKAPDRDTRLLSARALIASATEYELGAIYQYLETYPDDDAVLTKSLRVTAEKFEKEIAARDAAEAAAAPKEF